MHFLLIYELASDYLEKRPELRPAHLAHARAAVDRGDLVLGGALAEPVDQAVLLFRCESANEVAAFALADPYVQKGLVVSWRVRPWSTVVGKDASIELGL